MTKRIKLWFYGSLLFALLNVGGAVFAADVSGDPAHVATHVFLAFLGLYVAWRVRRPRAGPEAPQAAPLFDERLERIEQSLDAIAVEVERVEEGQRYVMKLGQQADEKKTSL